MSGQGWDRGSLDRHNALTPPDAERVARYCNAMGEKNNTIHGQRLARAAMGVADADLTDALQRLGQADAEIERLSAAIDDLDSTIGRVKTAADQLLKLQHAALEDTKAGYRNCAGYADAYENAVRHICEALEKCPS